MSSHVTLHAGRWIINMDNLTMTDEDLVASQAEARRRNTLLEEHGVDVEDKGTSDHAPLDYVEDEAHSRARPSGEPPRLDLFVEEKAPGGFNNPLPSHFPEEGGSAQTSLGGKLDDAFSDEPPVVETPTPYKRVKLSGGEAEGMSVDQVGHTASMTDSVHPVPLDQTVMGPMVPPAPLNSTEIRSMRTGVVSVARMAARHLFTNAEAVHGFLTDPHVRSVWLDDHMGQIEAALLEKDPTLLDVRQKLVELFNKEQVPLLHQAYLWSGNNKDTLFSLRDCITQVDSAPVGSDTLIALVALDYTVHELIINGVLEQLPAESCSLCGLFVFAEEPPFAAAQQPKFSAFESSNDVMSEEEAHTFIFNHEVLPPEADTGQWIGEVHFIPCGHYMHVACALQCAMEGAMPEGSDPLGFTGLGLTEHVPVIPRQCLACSGPVHEALITCRYGKACRKDKATPPYTLT